MIILTVYKQIIVIFQERGFTFVKIFLPVCHHLLILYFTLKII